ncbi:MAG: hypothetical protein RLZZ53_2227 [Acidobacteriota bacterium]|jgi:hypothetical protein
MVSADGFPPGCALIEVRVTELKQLFNSLDPTPFRERDLDPKAEEFIAGWAREIPAEQPLGLRIHIDRDSVPTEELAVVRDAVRDYFSHRAKARRLEVRLLFQRGRVSLAIGLAFLAAAIVGGDVAATLLRDTRFESLARESLMIGGWVAMWRPLEVFLYDWWPIQSEARLFDRLSAMTVMAVARSAEGWRSS